MGQFIRQGAGAGRKAATRRHVALVALVALVAPLFSLSVAYATTSKAEITTAVTADADADGFIDSVNVTFSQPMQPSAPSVSSGDNVPGIAIEGYTIRADAFRWNATGNVLTVGLAERATTDTDAKPAIVYRTGGGGLNDATGAELPSKRFSGTSDGAGPVLKSFAVRDLGPSVGMFNTEGDAAKIGFSEPTRIAGATMFERAKNLERAIDFKQSGGSGACNKDGDGVSTFNFPRPLEDVQLNPGSPAKGSEIFESPGPNGEAKTFVVVYKTASHRGSSELFYYTAALVCRVGIVPGASGDTNVQDQDQPLLFDAAGNPSRPQSRTVAARVPVTIADTELVSARTVDGHAGAPDGQLDALEMTFDDAVTDASFAGSLGAVSVLRGSEQAQAVGFATGTTANDRKVLVTFSAPWATDATPKVVYAKPADCSGSSGSGIKGTSSGSVTCVGSFDLTASDGAGPVLQSARTVDGDTDGAIDAVRVRLSESATCAGVGGWAIDGTAPSSCAAADEARTLELGYTGPPPSTVAYSGSGDTKDAAGNQLTGGTASITDGTGPLLKAATVYDADKNGALDHALVEFTKPLREPSQALASSFLVGGRRGTAFEAIDAGDVANDRFLTVRVEVPGTAAQDVQYAPGEIPITDQIGNAAPSKTLAAANVVDEAAPVGAIQLPGRTLKAGTHAFSARFSEPMKTDLPSASVNGRPVTPSLGLTGDLTGTTHTNGWRNDDPAVWEGSFTVAQADCDKSEGCAATAAISGASDRAGKQAGSTTTDVTIDTVAPQAARNLAFAAVLPQGEQAPANVLNMFASGYLLRADITTGEASGGRAQFLLDGSVVAESEDIAQDAASVSGRRTYVDARELQQAVPEGTHTVAVRLCDVATNCTDSQSLDVRADYSAVSVELTEPTANRSYKPGDDITIAWATQDEVDDFAAVKLSWSRNASSGAQAIADSTEPTGTYAWTAPNVVTPTAVVHATSYDTAGNRARGDSPQFAIQGVSGGGGGGDDGQGGGGSNPVSIVIQQPSGADPLLPSGTATIKWTATGPLAPSNPISIDYSLNNGGSWSPINGGAYDGANDGAEAWTVPTRRSFTVLVRVSARDTAQNVTSAVTARLATGIGGYVLGGHGRIYGFGLAGHDVRESYAVRSGDAMRGMVLQRSKTAGYALRHDGRVYPFAVGRAAMPRRPASRFLGRGRAVDIVLRTDTSGYVLDRYGRLWPFGGAPRIRHSATFRHSWAREVVMYNYRGGYVLDTFGRLWPFAVGGYPMVSSPQPRRIYSRGGAASVLIRSNDRSGWVMHSSGRLTAFGGAPPVASEGVGSRVARGIVALTPNGGYWIDYLGRMHRWGMALGNPAKVRFSSRTQARGLAG